MAGRPIEIEIGINADNVDRGTDQVVDGLDNIQDALRDVDRTADRTADNMSDGMSDTGRQIRRDLTQALDAVSDAARTTGRTVGRDVSDGADRASEGFDQMSDDAASNAQEIAGSFDGSAESLVDGFQGAAAEMFAGFGPAGMAAGLAVAAGIGLAMAALQGNADLINENKEKMLELAQTIKENGGVLTEADYIKNMEEYGYAIQDTKEWWEIFQADAVSGFEELKKISDATGKSMKTIFTGAFGDLEDTSIQLGVVGVEILKLKAKMEALRDLEGYIDPVDAETLATYEKYEGLLEENKKKQEEAAEVEKLRRQAIEGTTEATLEDIAALQKKNDLLQEGVTTELDYRDQVEQTNAIIAENGNTLDINTQKGRDNQRTLMDLSDEALNMADSQLRAGVSADVVAANLDNQRESILLQLDAMTGSRAESERYAQALGLIPKDVITEIKTNGGAETKAEIEGIPATKETDVTVTETGSAEVDARIQSIEGKQVKVDVDDEYTVQEVQNRIDGIRGRDMVKVDVDDDYTVSEVQKRINGIQGKTVDINVRIANYGDIERSLNNLTAPRSVTVTVNEQLGQGSGV